MEPFTRPAAAVAAAHAWSIARGDAIPSSPATLLPQSFSSEGIRARSSVASPANTNPTPTAHSTSEAACWQTHVMQTSTQRTQPTSFRTPTLRSSSGEMRRNIGTQCTRKKRPKGPTVRKIGARYAPFPSSEGGGRCPSSPIPQHQTPPRTAALPPSPIARRHAALPRDVHGGGPGRGRGARHGGRAVPGADGGAPARARAARQRLTLVHF